MQDGNLQRGEAHAPSFPINDVSFCLHQTAAALL